MKKALILGGGLAGIEAALHFRKEGFTVELVSDREYLFINPIAIWIPVRKASFEDVAFPLAQLARRHKFHLTVDRVVALNAGRREITLEKAGKRNDADLVIVALGAAKTKHEGLEHTLTISDPRHALLLRERLEGLVESGRGRIACGFGGNPKDPSGVRGGPAFEVIFNIHHYLKKHRVREQFDLTFFAPMVEPGARLGQTALSMMQKMFQSYRLHSCYGQKIVRFKSNGIVFEDGTWLESDLTMFIPACDGHPVVKSSDLGQNEAGFVRINDHCEVEDVKGWYAIGDVAALEGPNWRAKQGHLAEVMARCAAHNAAVAFLGKKQAKKGHREHITILCLMDMGNGAGLVYRDNTKAMLVPMPILGHWLKIGWGHYYKLTKMNRIPRIPGM